MVQRLARGIDPLFISAVLNVIGTALLLLHVGLRPSPLVYDASRINGMTVVADRWCRACWPPRLGGIVWNRALMVLGVARTALYSYWVPIFGVLFAVLLLGEPLTVWHGVGLAAVLAGTWLGTRSH